MAGRAVVAAIDPDFADTESMTDPTTRWTSIYPVTVSWLQAKRSGEERVAAAVVRATTRADVNHVVKPLLDVRKCSFWPQERAVEASGMEYGGITPVGVP